MGSEVIADPIYPKCGFRARRQQEDDPDVRIGWRPPYGGVDSEANRGAERSRAGAAEWLADRDGTREKVLVAQVHEMPAGRHVAGLRCAHLEEARELNGRGDVAGGEYARRCDRRVGACHIEIRAPALVPAPRCTRSTT